MPYDSYTHLFGPSDDPEVIIKLPLTLTSGTFNPYLHAVLTLCASPPPSLANAMTKSTASAKETISTIPKSN